MSYLVILDIYVDILEYILQYFVFKMKHFAVSIHDHHLNTPVYYLVDMAFNAR